MTRLSGGGASRGVHRPPDREPPRWLLALRCAAVALLLAGMLLGGERGGRLVDFACLVFPGLVGTFLALLTLAYLRPPDRR